MPYRYLLYLLLLLTCRQTLAANISLCYEEQNYPPYLNEADPTKQKTKNLLIDALKHAADQTKTTLKFIRKPWLRCLAMVKKNQLNGVFAIIKTPERATEFAFPTDPNHYLVKVDYPLFVLREGRFNTPALFNQQGEFDLNYYNQHKQYGLAAPLGYIAYQYLQANHLLANYTPKLNVGFKTLAIGHLDGFVVERKIGLYELNKLELSDKIIATEAALLSHFWHVAFNNDFYQQHSEMIHRFWQTLSENREKTMTTPALSLKKEFKGGL